MCTSWLSTWEALLLPSWALWCRAKPSLLDSTCLGYIFIYFKAIFFSLRYGEGNHAYHSLVWIVPGYPEVSTPQYDSFAANAQTYALLLKLIAVIHSRDDGSKAVNHHPYSVSNLVPGSVQYFKYRGCPLPGMFIAHHRHSIYRRAWRGMKPTRALLSNCDAIALMHPQGDTQLIQKPSRFCSLASATRGANYPRKQRIMAWRGNQYYTPPVMSLSLAVVFGTGVAHQEGRLLACRRFSRAVRVLAILDGVVVLYGASAFM